jgi:MinD-like ATPase involved in chromosome partitioning or flagellar assembly
MIVAVSSWRGIGATTAALALAACAARDTDGAWLVEADPAGGTLAGRMRFAPTTVGGLERVAFPNDRCSLVEALHDIAHHDGRLRIVTAPADPFRAHACHRPRVAWVEALTELSGTVVIDIGRMRAGSPAWPVVQRADVLLAVTSPEVSAAVAAGEWLSAEGRVAPTEPGFDGTTARLVVVDSPGGLAFARSGLLADLADGCAGWLPWDPAAVDLLHRGATADDRRLARSPLVTAAGRIVEALSVERAVAS